MQYIALLAFACLLLLNLLLFYTLHVSKKLYLMSIMASNLHYILKAVQKDDPIYLRSVVNKLDEEPREIAKGLLYGQSSEEIS